jgi:DNA-directed RNA polymerase subunit M/transcription elongation factor TFIIS
MQTKYCPECGNGIAVDKHTYLAICPSCYKCVQPKDDEIKQLKTNNATFEPY